MKIMSNEQWTSMQQVMETQANTIEWLTRINHDLQQNIELRKSITDQQRLVQKLTALRARSYTIGQES